MQTAWRELRIGAGGFITGIDIANDGTKVCRCDTFGAYIWDNTAAEWKLLLTPTSMPAGEWGHEILYEMGVYEIAVSPIDSNRIYAVFNGYVYKSADKGKTFTKTALAQSSASPNDDFRTLGRKMAIDPANPDVVYFGTPDKGLWVTTNGGTSWSKQADIPASRNTAGMAIAFDTTSGTVGGRTRGIYVSSYGNGVYRSTDAGASFAALPGSPTSHRRIICDLNGALWMTDARLGQNVSRYTGGRWADVPDAGDDTHAIAINPADRQHIVVANAGGSINQSFDGGTTWTGRYYMTYPAGSGRRVATDIPWLAWTNEDYMSTAEMRFDPSATNKLYIAEGIGVWYTNPPATRVGFDWNSQSKGIEQLVTNRFVSPAAGSNPLYFAWDRPVFQIKDPDVYPAVHGPNRDKSIVMGWGGDYAVDDPRFIVGLINWWGTEQSGYSTDAGATWTKFATAPAEVVAGKIGGSMAVSTKDNIVWVPSNNSNAYYTKDRGATWLPIVIPGVPVTGETGWGWAYYINRQCVAADRVTAGTFYLYNYLAGSVGLYRSTDGGANWTRIYNREIAGASTFNASLAAVPGKAGHLFFTSGGQSGANPNGTEFMRSTDGGANWTSVADMLEVYDFGFGKAAAGSDYPAIYVAGYYKRAWGIYRSDDNAATWTKIGDFPNGNFDSIKSVAGDMNVYGRVYIGFSGSGAAVADLKPAVS